MLGREAAEGFSAMRTGRRLEGADCVVICGYLVGCTGCDGL